MVRKTKGGKEIIDIDYDEAAQIVTASTSANVMQVQAMGRISRASLEESTQRALTTHQDVKSPDDPNYLHQLGLSSKEALERINGLPDGFLDNLKSKTLIDKYLLQEIRDLLNNGADEYTECKDLRDKLDKIYPFLC